MKETAANADAPMFSEVDPESYAELRQFFADGALRYGKEYHFLEPSPGERERLFEATAHLRVRRACPCAQPECRTYAFVSTNNEPGGVITFESLGIACVMLNSLGEISEFERLTS